MKIVTWNVNSIRAREERLAAWLDTNRPDLVCLQEIKVSDEVFPRERIRALGYEAAVHGQKTYNGVAVLAREPLVQVRCGLRDGVDDPQARLIDVRAAGVRVICVYVPNGQVVGSDKWTYKLQWFERLGAYLARECDPREPLAVCGDFNVAFDELDVARPEEWRDTVLFHEEAREQLGRLCAWGLRDVFREKNPAGKIYSWWDYRALGFQKNNGLRIDHVLVTEPLAMRCVSARVDREERKGKQASDHAPVIVEFA